MLTSDLGPLPTRAGRISGRLSAWSPARPNAVAKRMAITVLWRQIFISGEDRRPGLNGGFLRIGLLHRSSICRPILSTNYRKVSGMVSDDLVWLIRVACTGL